MMKKTWVWIVIAVIIWAVVFSSAINQVKEAKSAGGTEPEPSQQHSTSVQKREKKTVDYEIVYQNCRLYDSTLKDKVDYWAVVEIENTGTEDLYLGRAVFDFEDLDGHLLETDDFISKDPDIIAPGEHGYFYNRGILDNVKIDDDYNFKAKVKAERSIHDIVRYDIYDVSTNITGNDALKFTGRVKNNTEKNDSMIWVAFILFDKDGTPIGAGGTNVLDVEAGQSASFERTFYEFELEVPASEVASYEIYACKTQYQ